MTHDGLDGVLPLVEAAPEGSSLPSTGDHNPVLRAFVGQLVVSYVVEEGDTGRPFRHQDLRASGSDEPTLHRRTLENLARHVEKVGIRLRPYGSMMAVLFDGDLEATLMLYPTLWTHLQKEMGDEMVVAVPARDVLAVSPGDSPRGISELRAIVRRVWTTDDHPLSPDLFHFSGEQWRVWQSPLP